MSESQQNKQYNDDEIDLRKLFQAIGNFFARIWYGIINLLVFIRRETINQKVLFIILIILGLAGGFGAQQIVEPHYRTSLLLNSTLFRGQLIENAVSKLDLLTKEEDRTELAMILDIPIEMAEKIKEFEAIPFVSEDEVIQVEVLREQLRGLQADEEQIDQVINRIQIENKSIYEIVVRVYDTNIIPQLEGPIAKYFQGNTYISKRLAIIKHNRELKRSKLMKEANKMDSLKRAIYDNLSTLAARNREGSNNVILAEDNMANPISVFREDMGLYDEQLEIERQLALEPEFEVVDGFTTFSKPESAGLVVSTIYSVLIAIGLGYLFLLLKGIDTYLSKVEKEQQIVEKSA